MFFYLSQRSSVLVCQNLFQCTEPHSKPRDFLLRINKLAALETTEMARGCSHCGHNGHNSRTCPDRGVRLFGVRLTDGVMRKSVSMGNLSHYASPNNPPSPPSHSESGAAGDGYVSDGLVQTSNNTRERKKGQYSLFLWLFVSGLFIEFRVFFCVPVSGLVTVCEVFSLRKTLWETTIPNTGSWTAFC